MPGARPLASVLVALAAVSLCAVTVAWHTGSAVGRRAELLFDWSRFTQESKVLRRQASDLTAHLGSGGGDGAGQHGMSREVQEKGADIKQALAKLMRGLHETHAGQKRRGVQQQHKYVPMDQELAILKVITP